MKVAAMMSQPARSCSPHSSVRSVVDTMRRYDCGMVPVVDESGAPVGVVTDRDVCLALGTGDVAAAATLARSVMRQPVVSCAADEDCVAALLTMRQHRVRRLPVVGAEGALVGILSIDDIVRWAAQAPATDPLRMLLLSALAGVEARPAGGHRP